MVAPLAPETANRRTGRALFLLALGIYLVTAGGSLTSTDAVVSFDLTASLVERGSIALSSNLTGSNALEGVDGRYYSPFGIAQSVWDAPFYLFGRAITAAGVRIGKPDSVPKALVALSQTLLGAAIVWLTFRLGLAVAASRAAAGWAALTLAIGSLLWPYARFGFNQPLACATLLAAVLSIIEGVRHDDRRRIRRAGWWFAAALLTRHEIMIAMLPLAAWLWWAGQPTAAIRAKRLRALAPGVAAGLAFWLVYNWIRFGNPLEPGYLRDPVPGFGASVVAGVTGLLFSPGGSILLYSPFAAFGIWGLWREIRGGDRAVAWLFASIIATFLLFYGQLGNWTGWRAYGPRYLLITLPYFAAGFALWLRTLTARQLRAAGVAVCLTGFVVQWPGVLMDYAKVSQADAVARGRQPTRLELQWRWRESMLARNTAAAVIAVPANVRYVAGIESPPHVPAPAGPDDRGFSQQLSFSLDWWWLYLFYLGVVPRLALPAIVAAALIWIVYWSRRLAL